MISAKLTFCGLCREAMEFYGSCFDVQVISQKSFRETEEAFPQGLAPEFHDFIFSAELELTLEGERFYMTVGDTPTIVFTGTDGLHGVSDNIAFDIHMKDLEKMRELYKKFTENGSKNNIPLEETEKGARCSFIDPYGICWTIYCDDRKNVNE